MKGQVRRGLILGLVLIGFQMMGVAQSPAWAAPEDFPRPAVLEGQVEFWRRIFAVYSRYELVFHDARYPQKIYKVLDFRPLLAAGMHPFEVDRRMRSEEVKTRLRIQNSLWSLHQMRGNFQNISADEQRIVRLFSDSASSSKFVAAQEHVRVQRGLREKTRQALITAGRYFPRMEAIFRSYGLPVELTRLPIVESSFNAKAYSKVGAAGLWQFMPGSARMYMRLNDVVDDRRDPLLSTEAAARHLRDDYRYLKDWGLAVTAYNHGRTGVGKAANAVGSRDIADIVRRYSSKTFGFASRNFYTEFLAAVDIERNRVRYFGPLRPEKPIRFEEVSTQHYLDFTTLARVAGVTKEQFAELNPAFHPHVQSGRVRVPPQVQLRVPEGRAGSFRLQYAGLNPRELFSSQKSYYGSHRIVRGDSIGKLARRYGVSAKAILAANDMKTPRLRIGRTIKIPPRPEKLPSTVAQAKPVQSAPAALKAGERMPQARVTAGEPATPAAASRKPDPQPMLKKPAVTDKGTAQVAKKKPVDKRSGKVDEAGRSSKAAKGTAAVKPASTRSKATPRGYVSHKVKPGQTLEQIARRYGASVSEIRKINRLSSSRIRAGQVLKIPL